VPEDKDKKSPMQKAMAKECIFIVAAMIAAGIPEEMIEKRGKCRGAACGQYAEFVNKCGFSK
jgi:hypothetical protein